jgi:hypothetical protein
LECIPSATLPYNIKKSTKNKSMLMCHNLQKSSQLF